MGFEEIDDEVAARIIGVWEHEMQQFLASSDAAGAVRAIGTTASARVLVLRSDSQLYVNLTARTRRRRR